MATVLLKRQRAKPFFFRHPWVFSGAIDRIEGSFTDGDIVDVADASGRFAGRGFINSRSQIVVRLVTWQIDEAVDRSLFERRIAQARSAPGPVAGSSRHHVVPRDAIPQGPGVPLRVSDLYAQPRGPRAVRRLPDGAPR